MGGYQNFMCLGNLGADPEMRYTSGGKAVANFSIAVNDTWKDKDGAKREDVEWFNCRAWGKAGEIISEHLKKGDPILITSAKFKREEWEDREGGKRRTWILVVREFQFVGTKKAEGEGAPPF